MNINIKAFDRSLSADEQQLFSTIMQSASTLGVEVFVIGGYVRDGILNRPSKDIDFVVLGSGIDLANVVASQLAGCSSVSIFKNFGTAMFKWRDLEIEFVGARRESYSHHSRKPKVEAGTLEEDQLRRDFTINALAISMTDSSYQLLDSFGGMKDLDNRIIRTPTDPDKTFSDDPLRMLRAIRFACQLDFSIDESTMEAIAQNANRMKIVSKERIQVELNKMMLSSKPSKAFLLLDEGKLLKGLIPELEELKGVEHKNGHGHKDNFYHSLQVLDQLAEKSDNLFLRWAALLHDIAKPATKRYEPDHGWTFHGHEALGAAWIPRIFRRLSLPMDHRMKYVQKLIRLHLRPIALVNDHITDSAVRRLLFDAGDDLEDLLLLCESDITSKNPIKVEKYKDNYKKVRKRLEVVEEKDHIRNWEPPIDGKAIMETFQLKPSRRVGEIKTAIREAILDGEIPNEYDAAYDYMCNIGRRLGLRTHHVGDKQA